MLKLLPMEDFYKKLKEFKKKKGISYKALGGLIDKEEAAMRMAVKRESLTILEEERLEKYFAETEQQEKTPLREVRFEDLVAIKVIEQLKPIMKDIDLKLETILEHINNYELDMDDLKEAVEDTKQAVIKRS